MEKSQQKEKKIPENKSSEKEENSDRFVFKVPGFSISYENGVFQIELPIFTFEISINLFLRLFKWFKTCYEKCLASAKQHKNMIIVMFTILLVISIMLLTGIWYVNLNQTKTQEQFLNKYNLLSAGCINGEFPWIKLLKIDKSNKDLLTAQQLFFNNKLDQAEDLFKSVIKKKSANKLCLSFCHYGLGRIMYIKEQYQDAKNCFKTAVSMNPNFSLAILAKGIILEKQGLFQKALEQYKTSLAITEQQCQNLNVNHHYNINKVLFKNLNTITQCENSDECRLRLKFDIEKLLKQPKKKSDTAESGPDYQVMFLSFKHTGFNSFYAGENMFWSDLISSHTCSQSDQIHQLDLLIVYGLLKRLELPYHSMNNLNIALNLAKYLPVDYIISGEISLEKTDKVICVKVLNALNGDVIEQILEKVSNNSIVNVLEKISGQVIKIICHN